MKIRDLKGNSITVTDIDKAIQQAENFKDMHHVPPVPYDKVRQKYWTDVYNKLLVVKANLNHEQSGRKNSISGFIDNSPNGKGL